MINKEKNRNNENIFNCILILTVGLETDTTIRSDVILFHTQDDVKP